MNDCTYLLPIRRSAFDPAEATHLAEYLAQLTTAIADVIIVDGSPADVFEEHHALWSPFCRHHQVDRRFGYLNDKVNGIHTGVELATQPKIILADDDIRYSVAEIERLRTALDKFEVVRPQNFLTPTPWWARMEAARMLINRATLRSGDYPGTCGFRRELFLRLGHYDGDVLFDNEEIIRHFARHGARVDYAIDFFVRKRSPKFRKWIEQRPRQAYEDFPLRGKTALFFTLPLIAIGASMFGGLRAGAAFVALMAMGSIGVAFAGRQRGRARKYFAFSAPLAAPLWICERTLSTYWALYWYLARGGYPFGDRMLTKGVGRDWFAGGRIASEAIARSSRE